MRRSDTEVAMRDHNNLRAFQLAKKLALEVYKATRAFPRSEEFGLKAQMRRAAVSVPSNIVEGCARRTQGDFVRFLNIALSSSREIEFQVSLAQELGYLTSAQSLSLHAVTSETGKVIYGLIKSLSRRR